MWQKISVIAAVCVLTLLLASCSILRGEEDDISGEAPPMNQEEVKMSLQLTSPAFNEGGAIPAVYTCTGDGISPELAWSGAPDGTQSFALIMDDPDAPGRTWVHWVIANLPADAAGLPERVESDAGLPGDAVQGRNSRGGNNYDGPCPPRGTHRYFFKLYALDTMLDLAAGASKEDVLAAMEGHVLAEGQLMGTYQK
jgi:Raf kinase inhibitor-like YbhB/YbcL family protein